MKIRKIMGIMILSMLLTGCQGQKTDHQPVKIETETLQTNLINSNGELPDSVSEEIVMGETALLAVSESIDDISVSNGVGTLTGQTQSETGKDSSGHAEQIQTGFGDPATMNHAVDGRELPIYCVDTEENKIALSFDAAWGDEDTEQILQILKDHDIHVTFFATGGWVESYPDDVKAVLAAGHDLGNHSANHLNMSELSDQEKKEELMSVHEKVKELTGYEMFLFRPPYGDYDNSVVNVAKDCGYYAIQWDVDSLDWMNYGVDSIIETVTEHKNLGNGSIILCHNGAEYTAQALDELITKLEEQGYEIVPISELIYRENFHLNYEGRQIKDE